MNAPGQYLHTSNRMEDLAEMLARLLAEGLRDPFQEETVLVQSRGMGRWLSLRLADTHGICLNVRFPFPREVVEEILEAALPGWTPARHYRREAMVWRLFRLLEEFHDDSRFEAIAHYLEGDNLLKRIQLADRLGSLFDQYLMYRPDWLIEWEEGRNDRHWQAVLWQRLAAEAEGELNLAHAWRALRAGGGESPPPWTSGRRLPPRLCLFGISSLPPLFLQVLQRYAAGGELHLFLLQPTDQYWGDLVSRKARARLAGAQEEVAAPAFLEEGHPLVASLGRQGQDLLNLLIDADFQQSEARESFSAAGHDSLLHRLQTEIHLLADPEMECGEKPEVAETDTSIQIHSCHSPMREVEVLRDQLLDLLQQDPDLRPRDILVMIPDIESYAPYVQAVFGGAGEEKIPFSVVDRRPRSAHQAIDGWFRLLELAGSRFRARDVVALLESPPFRSRFGLNDRDVNCLRGWIQATGIRWGVDAGHREEQGLPPLGETTWRYGIAQWLLGYAMREESGGKIHSFREVFPFDQIEGSNIPLLERFLETFDWLFEARAILRQPRPLHAWCEELSRLLENLFGGLEELSGETEAIRNALLALGKAAGLSRCNESLPLEVIRYFLEKVIDDTAPRGGFLSGGVTFCTLQPMRTIPARVVCLLGLNDDAFPRRVQQLGFDRMRDKRRVGDRSPREDDRYLFLETLLSVREKLLISYVGQSARDLSEAPPSVLVSELLDHLDQACRFPGGRSARDFLVQRHRLQPFHPDYFSGGRLFSYSAENAAACRRLIGETAACPPFVQAPLPDPEPEWRTVSLQQLARFFRNPSEYFVRERLGLRLPGDEEMLEDSEIFSLNPLLEYKSRKAAVDGLIEKRETADWQRLQARGQTPLGSPGVAACEAIGQEAGEFVSRLSRLIDPAASRTNREVDLRLDDFHLRGRLGPFFGGRLVLYRPAALKPKDFLAGWIQHLAACCLPEVAEVQPTLLAGSDGTVVLAPREDAAERLIELLRYYWRGLSEPLPFFPDTSWVYVDTLARKGRPAALDAAWTRFSGPAAWFAGIEVDDPSVALCWQAGRRAEALGPVFEEIATVIWRDLDLFKTGEPQP